MALCCRSILLGPHFAETEKRLQKVCSLCISNLMIKSRLEERYAALKEKPIERKKDFDAFIKMLETDTNWLTSPASTRFHLSEEKGLLKHSVSVAENLVKFRDLLAPEIPDESCVIVGLFHDVGKVGMPGKPYYLPNPNQEQVKNRGIRYIVNSDLVHIDLPTRSLYLVARYIPLNEDEIQAIRYHDGQYIPENRSVAHRETKLTRLLQYADNWTGCVLEKNDP